MYLAPDTRLLQCEQSKCLAESLPLYASKISWSSLQLICYDDVYAHL